MHRRTFLGIGLAALCAAPAAHAVPRCTLPGAQTIAVNSKGRVFAVAGKGAVKRRIYGCLAGHKPMLIASDVQPKAADESHITNDSFRLGGPWVSWHRTTSSDSGAGEYASTLVVRSLGKTKRHVEVDVSRYQLKALQVAPNGDVAWVLALGTWREVDGVAATAASATPLAVAEGISSASLQVGGGLVTFKVAGVKRTVALAAPPKPARGTDVGRQGLDGRFGDCGTLVPANPRANVFTAATQLARAPGGALVSAGTATTGKGNPLQQDELVVARFSASGRFDSTFGTNGVVVMRAPWPGGFDRIDVTGLAVQADGRIVVAGSVVLANAVDARTVLVRFNPDGTLDDTFGSGGVARDVVPAAKSADLRDLVLDAKGNLLIAGQRDDLWYVARLLPNGGHDPAFGTGGLVTDPGKDGSAISALALQPDGTIFAGGGTGTPLLVRLDPSGTILSSNSANPPAKATLLHLAPTPTGGVVAVGSASNVDNPNQVLLARYAADGRPDTSFSGDGFVLDPQISAPSGLARAAGGALFVTASFFLRPGGYGGDGLIRYAADGTRDLAFGLRGALGGTSSYGLNDYDVLLGEGGTAYVAQDNGGAFGVSRFAVGAPATTQTSGRSTVCAMATATKIAPLVANRRLDISLRLRAPGNLHLEATIVAGGKRLKAGHADVLRPYTEGAIASIPLSKAAVQMLRGAKDAKLTVAAGAPGKAKTTYRAKLTR